jgi:hypothetical protein
LTHRSTRTSGVFWKHTAIDRLREPALPNTNACSWAG